MGLLWARLQGTFTKSAELLNFVHSGSRLETDIQGEGSGGSGGGAGSAGSRQLN